jgi:hypothetical protein
MEDLVLLDLQAQPVHLEQQAPQVLQVQMVEEEVMVD